MPKQDIYQIVTGANPLINDDTCHPALSRVAANVEDPTASEIKQIVAKMIRTAEHAGNAAGLAAPQVNISKKIFIYREESEEDFIVAINSSYEPLNDQMVLGWEGCLSLPGYMGEVSRYSKIRHTYTDLNGKEITEDISGFKARVVQHENDHTNGIMYTAKLSDISRFGTQEEMMKLIHPEDVVDIDEPLVEENIQPISEE